MKIKFSNNSIIKKIISVAFIIMATNNLIAEQVYFSDKQNFRPTVQCGVLRIQDNEFLLEYGEGIYNLSLDTQNAGLAITNGQPFDGADFSQITNDGRKYLKVLIKSGRCRSELLASSLVNNEAYNDSNKFEVTEGYTNVPQELNFFISANLSINNSPLTKHYSNRRSFYIGQGRYNIWLITYNNWWIVAPGAISRENYCYLELETDDKAKYYIKRSGDRNKFIITNTKPSC